MADDTEFLSEEEALRLWQRAAQLQAEAARRAEALTPGAGADGNRESDATDTPQAPPEGYPLTHVRAAALEAGIGSDFVEAALAEVRAERAVSGRRRGWGVAVARWIIGDPHEALVVRRTVRATPEEVLAAMEAVFPNEPFTLALRDREGDPLRGGVLVFDIQGVGFTQGGAGFRGDASFADLRQVYATLAPHPGAPPRTEVTLRSPVSWAWPLNAGLAGGFTALGGGLGLGAGYALAGVLVAVGGPVAAGLAVAVGAGGAGAGSLGLFRALYRYAMGRGEQALLNLAGALAAKAEGGWGIAPPVRG